MEKAAVDEQGLMIPVREPARLPKLYGLLNPFLS